MFYNNSILAGKSGDADVCILTKMANRHGLIAGATGTGKTVTLKVLAESFSDAGVPVFLADVKGDIAGMCMPGEKSEDMDKRINDFGLAGNGFGFKSYPTRFWDIYGQKGMPLRTTVSEFGPLLLARLLELNQIQSDILNIVFKIADDEGLLLIDMKDLKAMLNYVADNPDKYKADYGNVSSSSAAAIIRALVSLEDRGGDKFFGEPALDINDFFKVADDGRGYLNLLESMSLITDPMIYSTFLLWLMSELFEQLPEVGDLDKPKLVFFFDEAHLLFKDTPKALLAKIEQVVKLIRSKGVGIYFVTQNPSDIPDAILAQLGNKIQHALHAYTPSEMKSVKAAAESFRVNPEFDTEEVLQQLGTGEALVSFLQEDGTPMIVQKAKILPPQSKMGTIDDNMRAQVVAFDKLKDIYSEMVDRDSAYEFFQRKVAEVKAAADEQAEAKQKEKEAAEAAKQEEAEAKQKAKEEEAEAKRIAKEEEAEAKKKAKEEEAEAKKKAKEEEAAAKKAEKEAAKKANTIKNEAGKVAKSAAGTVGRQLGNTIGKSVGGSFGKTLGGNIGAQLGRGILQTLFKM